MKFNRSPLLVTMQDKYRIRDYATPKGVNCAHLLFATDNPEDIPFDDFDGNFLIKANHACGWNILFFDSVFYMFRNGSKLVNDDGSLLNKDLAKSLIMTKQEVITQCQKWLNSKYVSDEWAYQDIKPMITIEVLLEAADQQELKDYRFYTFHGEVVAINVGSAKLRKDSQNMFFNQQWQEIELESYKEKKPDQIPERPKNLDDMISIARRLGSEIDFVRVDLYNTTKGIILGELTVYPEGGNRHAPTSCRSFNRWLGNQWKLGFFVTIHLIIWNFFDQLSYYFSQASRNKLAQCIKQSNQ